MHKLALTDNCEDTSCNSPFFGYAFAFQRFIFKINCPRARQKKKWGLLQYLWIIMKKLLIQEPSINKVAAVRVRPRAMATISPKTQIVFFIGRCARAVCFSFPRFPPHGREHACAQIFEPSLPFLCHSKCQEVQKRTQAFPSMFFLPMPSKCSILYARSHRFL